MYMEPIRVGSRRAGPTTAFKDVDKFLRVGGGGGGGLIVVGVFRPAIRKAGGGGGGGALSALGTIRKAGGGGGLAEEGMYLIS